MRGEPCRAYSCPQQLALMGIAALALLAGTAVYLLDREWQSAWFLALLADRPGGQTPGTVFGAAGQWLPSLSHTFAFCLLTASIVAPATRIRHGVCGAWALVGLLFELAQWMAKSSVVTASAIPQALHGQFDLRDLFATLAGALAAGVLLALTAPRGRPAPLARSRWGFRHSGMAVVGTLGVGSLLASGPGPEGPTDVSPDTRELPVYGYSIDRIPAAPAGLSITVTSDAQVSQSILSFGAPGVTGTYDTTYGFSLDAGSAIDIDTDGADPQLGAFRMTVLESLGWFDGLFLTELDRGAYRVDNGVDSVTVHVLAGIPDPPPTASIPVPTFEVTLNGAAPVVLEWSELNSAAGPLAQRQAARAYVLLTNLFDDAIPAVFLAESRMDAAITSTPEIAPCDPYRAGAAPPSGLPTRGSITMTRTAPAEGDSAGNFDFLFTDCTRTHNSIFIDSDRLYRGDMITTGWVNTVAAGNTLTNFGFRSVSFAGLRVNALLTQNPTLILEPTRTLNGGLGLVFFPP